MSIKLIMPMAGEGNRFKEKGYDTPKPLVPVKGIPMFQYTEQQIGIDFDERKKIPPPSEIFPAC